MNPSVIPATTYTYANIHFLSYQYTKRSQNPFTLTNITLNYEDLQLQTSLTQKELILQIANTDQNNLGNLTIYGNDRMNIKNLPQEDENPFQWWIILIIVVIAIIVIAIIIFATCIIPKFRDKHEDSVFNEESSSFDEYVEIENANKLKKNLSFLPNNSTFVQNHHGLNNQSLSESIIRGQIKEGVLADTTQIQPSKSLQIASYTNQF